MITKKTSILAVAILASSLLNATEVEIQLVGGKNFVDNDKTSTYDDSTVLGVRNNIFVNQNNGVQLAYDRLKDVNGTLDFHRYSVNYIHEQKDNNSKIHPFVLLGAGYEDSDENQAFFDAGIGASAELTNKVNLIAEIKGIKKHNNDFDVNTNIGLGLKIGNEPTNEAIKTDCVTENYATKLVNEEPCNINNNFSDEKVNCVR